MACGEMTAPAKKKKSKEKKTTLLKGEKKRVPNEENYRLAGSLWGPKNTPRVQCPPEPPPDMPEIFFSDPEEELGTTKGQFH